MKYSVVLEPQANGGYPFFVPALPSCVSQEETTDAAMANIREAMEIPTEGAGAYPISTTNPGVQIDGVSPAPKLMGHEVAVVLWTACLGAASHTALTSREILRLLYSNRTRDD